jgi:ABC-2 type transport system ATP-binding protein
MADTTLTDTTLNVHRLTKRYDGVTAVADLSFDVREGEIFGLLGPNGAGKTSVIRMIMAIFAPDEGAITVLGEPPGKSRERVGYLPEERGLYEKVSVLDVLVYFAQLKGLSADKAREEAGRWLERVELDERKDARVNSLSGGMQQKVQLISSFVHDPDLIILDEPFKGLDQVNVELVNEIIRELQSLGKTIVLSSHQLNLVEVLCDRILLIDDGRNILYGNLDDLKRRYSSNAVRLRTPAELGEDFPGVSGLERRDDGYLVMLDTDPQIFLKTLVTRDIAVEGFGLERISLAELFVKAVKEQAHA